jgi:hypothetical protein
MSTAIGKFDRVTAAGILARAALAVENKDNPAAQPTVPNEAVIRSKVIEDISRRYGISPSDTKESREQLCDALDKESDELLDPINAEAALERLAESGDLPSDLYKVAIVPNVEQIYGSKFPKEKQLIEETVHAPDLEQHYGPPKTPEDPHLISLFTKTFHDKYPLRSFIMLVAGERKELTLTVYQAWRLYPSDINLTDVSSPLEMLKRFAGVFGTDVSTGNQHGSVILIGDVPDGGQLVFQGKVPEPMKGRSSRTFTFSYFVQQRAGIGGRRAALLVAIDLDKYRDALADHGW